MFTKLFTTYACSKVANQLLCIPTNTSPFSVLDVIIPVKVPLHPLLGSNLVVPCQIRDNTGAQDVTQLPESIRWTYVTENKVKLILVAFKGAIHMEREYQDHVIMVNYPLVPTDATIEIQEVRSKDSGTYHCMYGSEDIYDSVDIQVQGTSSP